MLLIRESAPWLRVFLGFLESENLHIDVVCRACAGRRGACWRKRGGGGFCGIWPSRRSLPSGDPSRGSGRRGGGSSGREWAEGPGKMRFNGEIAYRSEEEKENERGPLQQQHKLVVGYALTSKKVKSFLQPKLEGLAR